jgi:peroxin-13
MTAPSSTASSSAAPALPDRPSTLNSVVNQNASNFTNQNRFGMNSSPYSSPYSSYSSPYSRFGGGGMYGGGMYGAGAGGYGYGGGMYGNNMYGGGGYGFNPGMDPNNPNNQSLTQTWNQSTAATFQIMESIVGAFGGFAQMLESAYMTTHSSFFGKSDPGDENVEEPSLTLQ